MKIFLVKGVPASIQRDSWWMDGPIRRRPTPPSPSEAAPGRWDRPALLVALILLADLLLWGAAPGLSLVVDFTPCSKDASARCGTIVWVWDPSDMPHGNVGDVIMPDLNREGGHWKGHLQNPRNGWIFKGTVTPDGPDLLRLKGCAGPICKSQTWRSLSSLARMVEAMP